jgi:hypothetical protein
VIDPGEIMAARKALGRLLAGYRKAAGLNQYQLAPHTLYGRSTIANGDLAIALVALGSPDEAAAHGRQALATPRVVDSVRTRAGDLDAALTGRYPDLPDTRAFHDQYRELLAGTP